MRNIPTFTAKDDARYSTQQAINENLKSDQVISLLTLIKKGLASEEKPDPYTVTSALDGLADLLLYRQETIDGALATIERYFDESKGAHNG